MLSWLCKLLARDQWAVEKFQDKDGWPRWRIRARNGEIVATSEAYSSPAARDETAERATKVRLVLYPALLLALCAPTWAAEVVYNFQPPPASNAACECNKDWEAKLLVPQFDPALGTLTGVRLEVPVLTGGSAGGAVLFENPSDAPVLNASAYAGVVFLYRFASDREWIWGGAEQVTWGQQLGLPTGVAGRSSPSTYIPPFDGGLDFLGPSATGFCMPPCGLVSPGATVWPFQQHRFVGTGVVEVLYQPRMNWYVSPEGRGLAYARNLPILPQEARVVYTYQ